VKIETNFVVTRTQENAQNDCAMHRGTQSSMRRVASDSADAETVVCQ